MTTLDARPIFAGAGRVRTPRRFLMVRPNNFDVVYSINPWMDLDAPVDRALAMVQWQALHDAYVAHGHEVEVIDDAAGLPDMVFAANGGLVVGGKALGARFLHPQRTGEEALFDAAFERLGLPLTRPSAINEGEGDLLASSTAIYAGFGFRTDPRAHAEVATVFGREVVTLELIDPRFYHLDTAMAVLDEDTVAIFPAAFSDAALAVLRSRFSIVIEASESDAVVLGLNIVSDGRNVFLEKAATGLAAQLREAGFHPVGIDMSEFRKSGGAVKCCTLEIRP